MDEDEGALAAEITGRFPPGAIRQVQLRAHGTGEYEVWLMPAGVGPGRPRRNWLAAFCEEHREALTRLTEDLPGLTGGRCRRLRIADRQRVMVLEISGRADGEDSGGSGGGAGGGGIAGEHVRRGDGGMEWEQTAVMARLGRVDLETLDTIVGAGYAASRAEAVRWALARIRERPAYQEVQRRVIELDKLKGEI